MFPTSKRLYRRALIAGVTVMALIVSVSAMATAQSPRLTGKVTVVSGGAGGNVQLSANYGSVKNSGNYLFNTEVHDATGKKVAQFTNTFWTNRGSNVKRAYNWDASKLADGKYTFSIGVSKPNWAGLLGWSDTAGSIVLGTHGWNSSAVANYSVSGTDPISLTGHFTSPAKANGNYKLEMIALDGTKQIGDWSKMASLQGSQKVDLVSNLDRTGLNGSYTIALKVSVADSEIYKNASAGVFTVTPPPPPTTTTTVPPTTTTTAPPVTTTILPATSSSNTGGTDGDDGFGDLPGWKLIFNENFNTPAAEGNFLNTYKNFSAYGPGWKDTSKNGTYDPKIISVSDGSMVMNLHTEGSTHYVAAPEPKINASSNQLYGRYTVRFKADQVAGYKTAWLLWPQSDQWSDGEIDFPEGNLNGSIDAFSHYTGTPQSQSAFSTGANFSQWHVATTEWTPGKVTFIMDGKVIGTATKNIPTTAMHWVLQTETQLSGGAPANNVSGNVYVDYAAAWSYQP